MPSPTRNRIIMDSVHGVCDLDETLRRVLDTPEIQRLRLIRQTGLAYLVYPGLEHSRFTHILGAYSIALRVFRHLRSLSEELLSTSTVKPSDLDELERAFLVSALCHDVGHTAFSHALEPLLLPNGMKKHDDCSLLLLKDGPRLADEIKAAGCDLEQVVQLLSGEHWVVGLSSLLTGPADVDRWDYLQRDTRAAGLVYGLHDLEWMIRSSSLFSDSSGRPRLMIDGYRGFVAFRHFFAARRAMYQQVYWHRTIRGAEQMMRAMFERAMEVPSAHLKDMAELPLGLRGPLTEPRPPNVEEFLLTDDVAVLAAIKYWAKSSTDPVLRYLARCFIERRLPKEVGVWPKTIPSERRSAVRAAVQEALRIQAVDGLGTLKDQELERCIDYLVLGDNPEYPGVGQLDEVLFELEGLPPCTFIDLPKDLTSELREVYRPFPTARLYVPADLAHTVQTILERS